ncbi:MAG: ArnT family glycosyltransferase, partial [Bacteroidia bacterium]
MAKQNAAPKKPEVAKTSLFERTEKSIGENLKIWQIGITVLSLICCFLMFDAKISIGHDDSLYIMAGNKFANDFFGYWYADNAPLYVMFLALPISMFGLNLMLLKLLSVFFFVLSIWILFSAFKNRIPHLLLVSSIIIFATNFFALSYASLTYTEAFFLMIQSAFFLVFFRHIDSLPQTDSSFSQIGKSALKWVLLGFMMWLLYFTKTVGIGTFAAVAVYFLFRKEWRNSLASVVSFVTIYAIMEGLKKALWGSKISNFAQSNILFLKDAYDPSKGQEDLSGFIDRFFGNVVIYLSGRFWEMMGFKEENGDFSGPLGFFTVALLVIGLIVALRSKQKYLSAAALYSAALLGVTFFALQTSWGQGRLVMVYLPLMLMTIFYGFYKLFDKKSNSSFQLFFFVLLGIFIWKNTSATLKKSSKNIPIVKKNLIKGDKFEGYTNDYKNFLMLSEWCADSLPKGSLVASRKAPMSFVYGRGMEFYPIYKANGSQNADSVLSLLKKNKVTHVIFANLRLDPKRSGDIMSTIPPEYPAIYRAYMDQDQKSIINTMQNYFSPVAQKYPLKFELVKQMGDDEEALLYKI